MGDMTDDQLDMDARVESSAMTPQEALAQALEAATDDPPGPVGFILTDESLAAAAIIDALPEGWLLDYRDKHVWEHALHTAKAVGAQQERERLRMKPIMGDEDNLRPYPLPKWVKTPTPRGEAPIDLLEHFRDWLLADPDEADR